MLAISSQLSYLRNIANIVNAYCQFSQQACTNFMQTYLYSLLSTHFFILTTNLHWKMLTYSLILSIDLHQIMFSNSNLENMSLNNLLNPISTLFSDANGITDAPNWCHGNNDFLQVDGKSMFNYTGHSTTTWTKFDPILTPSPIEWTSVDI